MRQRSGGSGDTPRERHPLFQIDGVTVRFGGLTALEDVSLAAWPHEVHGVIGPNGAGKTTLFNVCCGFTAAESPSVRWRGDPVPPPRPHELAARGIARTLQGLGLFRGLTVLENVMVGADRFRRSGFASALFGLPRSVADERAVRNRAQRALRDLDVDGCAAAYPDSLPYPIRKRVALARALVSEPELLLLDEPASGLGHDDMGELGELVRGLSDRMAVVLVDHHMDLVMSVCDRITVLDFGRVIATGGPDEIAANPAVVRAYLGEEAHT
ncbi:ABC transporter ATP-binding protein [Saccharomonospora piscinae]|uniref:ABC transporter ATP-binding protein n=1 Tax=Saccharomonospora piscinae TaxID=687388 RepID=A0A1V9A9T0_SACPI|nr:ABC transporter ATP-binding protein [Saccharomonospora piscinae]OQO93887.1 ABC transporter ATP-binding protein [Saccharomonospora piscinae]